MKFFEKQPLTGLEGYVPGVIETHSFDPATEGGFTKLSVLNQHGRISCKLIREASTPEMREIGVERIWSFDTNDLWDMDLLLALADAGIDPQWVYRRILKELVCFLETDYGDPKNADRRLGEGWRTRIIPPPPA